MRQQSAKNHWREPTILGTITATLGAGFSTLEMPDRCLKDRVHLNVPITLAAFCHPVTLPSGIRLLSGRPPLGQNESPRSACASRTKSIATRLIGHLSLSGPSEPDSGEVESPTGNTHNAAIPAQSGLLCGHFSRLRLSKGLSKWSSQEKRCLGVGERRRL